MSRRYEAEGEWDFVSPERFAPHFVAAHEVRLGRKLIQILGQVHRDEGIGASACRAKLQSGLSAVWAMPVI